MESAQLSRRAFTVLAGVSALSALGIASPLQASEADGVEIGDIAVSIPSGWEFDSDESYLQAYEVDSEGMRISALFIWREDLPEEMTTASKIDKRILEFFSVILYAQIIENGYNGAETSIGDVSCAYVGDSPWMHAPATFSDSEYGDMPGYIDIITTVNGLHVVVGFSAGMSEDGEDVLEEARQSITVSGERMPDDWETLEGAGQEGAGQ